VQSSKHRGMPSIFWATFSLGSLVQPGLAGGQRAAVFISAISGARPVASSTPALAFTRAEMNTLLFEPRFGNRRLWLEALHRLPVFKRLRSQCGRDERAISIQTAVAEPRVCIKGSAVLGHTAA